MTHPSHSPRRPFRHISKMPGPEWYPQVPVTSTPTCVGVAMRMTAC